MTPGGNFRRAAGVTFGIWYLVLATHWLVETVAGRFGWMREAPVDLVAVGLVALLVLPAWPLAARLADVRPAVRWTALAAAVFAIGFAQSVVNMVENRLLGVIPSFAPEHHALIRDRFARNFQGHLYLTFANVALLAFQFEVQRSATRAVRLAEARAEAARDRLTALRLQLNPHFLFNTLNALSSLIVTARADDADRMIERLSDFLRATLADDGDATVPLAEELAMVESYLDIEAVRFGDRMTIEIAAEDGLADRPVPGFILQPLIENAVKYGVARSARPVTIRVSAATAGDGALVLTVADDGPGQPPAAGPGRGGLGVGVANVRSRLAALHGAAARLDAGPGDDGGWIARIVLPA